MKRIVVGVAGFLGSGKSTVGASFGKLGAFVIDADKVVDALYGTDRDGFKRIRDFFGEEYVTKRGELNRKKLAKVVFNDPKKLKILNALIHPLVTTEIQKMIDQTRSGFVVVEATYFERKFLKSLINFLLWVETPMETAFQRVHARDGMTREMFEKIRRLQVKPENIDEVLLNDGSMERLDEQVAVIYRQVSTMNFSKAP